MNDSPLASLPLLESICSTSLVPLGLLPLSVSRVSVALLPPCLAIVHLPCFLVNLAVLYQHFVLSHQKCVSLTILPLFISNSACHLPLWARLLLFFLFNGIHSHFFSNSPVSSLYLSWNTTCVKATVKYLMAGYSTAHTYWLIIPFNYPTPPCLAVNVV